MSVVWKKLVFSEDAVTPAQWNQNGFENQTDSVISFTDATRTFQITPAVTSFSYYVAGVQYTKTAAEDIVISNDEGVHVIYYDGGTLSEAVNPTSSQVDSVIRTKAIVSIIYWDASEAEAIYVGEERHGKEMSPSTHSFLHFTQGLAYLSGIGLNTMSVDGNGSSDAHAQFGIDSGGVTDEDLYHAIDAVAAATGLPIYYMLGADSEWQKEIVSGFSVKNYSGGDGRLAYNQWTGAAWQLTEVAEADYVLCHVFATTEKDTPMIAIVGQADYTKVSDARAGAKTEILSLVTNDVLFPEIRPIATVIFKTDKDYANAVKAAIVSTDDGESYVDWRNESVSRTVVSTTDHGALSGLDADDHPQYLLRTEAHYTPLSLGEDYTIPTGEAFLAADEIEIESSYTLTIEGTGRMILQ